MTRPLSHSSPLETLGSLQPPNFEKQKADLKQLQVTYSPDTRSYLLALQIAGLGHSSNLWGKYLRTLSRQTPYLDITNLVLRTQGNKSPSFSCSGFAQQPLPGTSLIPTPAGIILQQFEPQASVFGVTHSITLWWLVE